MKFCFTLKIPAALPLLFLPMFVVAQSGSVVINEFMASNQTTATDEAGEYDDWIELYNKSSNSIDLTGWYLSDNPDNLDKWEFPGGATISPDNYLIVWADEDSSQGPLHANFKLSAVGEVLYLIDDNSVVVQEINFGQQQVDMGYARSPNGTGNFVVKAPTFKANNDTGISATDEAELLKMLTVFPNPASGGEVTLRSENAGRQAVGLFDQLGRLRLKTEVFNETSIDVSHLPAGLYFVKTEIAHLLLLIK